MVSFALYSKRFLRYAKYRLFDKKRLSKLNYLIESGKKKQAYDLFNKIISNTDLPLLSNMLTVGFYKDQDKYGEFLNDFNFKTGSSCGHGKYNNKYSPVHWLGFFNDKEFKMMLVFNPLCFNSNHAKFEFEIEQNIPKHSLEAIPHKNLPKTGENLYRYASKIHFKTDEPVELPIYMEGPLKIRVYHYADSKSRNVILQESFNN